MISMPEKRKENFEKKKRYFENRGKRPIIRQLQKSNGIRYVFYKKENWFILDDVVRIFFPIAKKDKFCCKPMFQKYIENRAKMSKFGTGIYKNNIRIVEYKPNTEHMASRKRFKSIPTFKQQMEKVINSDVCGSCGSCLSKEIDANYTYGLSLGFYKGDHLKLIDFHSIQNISHLFKDSSLHPILQFLINYSQLCRDEGKKARNAMTKKDKENVAASQKWKCNICGKMFENGSLYEIDHILPVHLGGRNHTSNLQALCSHCHAKKTDNDISYPICPITENKGEKKTT